MHEVGEFVQNGIGYVVVEQSRWSIVVCDIAQLIQCRMSQEPLDSWIRLNVSQPFDQN